LCLGFTLIYINEEIFALKNISCKLWISIEEKMSEVIFLTKQYIKMLRVLLYLETDSIPILPVLYLLKENVEARKKYTSC